MLKIHNRLYFIIIGLFVSCSPSLEMDLEEDTLKENAAPIKASNASPLNRAPYSPYFQVTGTRFRFHANENGFRGIDVMQWKPTKPNHAKTIVASFHGDIDPETSCNIIEDCTTNDCFQKNSIHWDANALTGLEGATSWTPKCPNTAIMGNSLVATSNRTNTANKGIGIYTYTGPKPNASGNAFFQPLQHGSTNIGIQGIYIGFPSHLIGSMKPFSSPCSGPNCGDRIRMRVWSKQFVKTVTNTENSQTQQKMALMLHNIADRAVNGRIEFTPYTLCAGINCNDNKYVHYAFDPNQNNVAFVGGRLLGGGQASEMKTSYRTTPVWESYGPSTMATPFETSWFHYQISWNNFVKTLRQFTDISGLNGSNNGDVAKLFGKGWSVKTNWELKHVRFAQEVYNRNWSNGDISSIGGHMSWFQVDAITQLP